eukprot:tig00020816_g14199.t1
MPSDAVGAQPAAAFADHTLFFDLDDTLYPKSNGIWEMVTERIADYMREKMGLPEEHVPAIMDACYKARGMTLAGLREGIKPEGLEIEYKVDELDFLAYVHGGLPYDKVIKPNVKLARALRSIPNKKWILSNSDMPHCKRVLERLGITDCFEGIIDIFAMDWNVKPKPEAYKKAMEIAGVTDPSKCIFFDDAAKNLKGAKEVGLMTVWVGREHHETDPSADRVLLLAEDVRKVLPELPEAHFDFAGVKALFFDLDDTLYPKSLGVWEIVTERIAEYMEKKMGLGEQVVPMIMDEAYRRYGMTLAGLRQKVMPEHLQGVSYEVDELDFLKFVHGGLPYDDMIQPSPALRAMLQSLPYPKWILSNSDKPHIERTLKRLGIEDCFDGIIDIFALEWNVKPSHEAYKRALKIAGVEHGREAVFFDDSLKNLRGAKELGLLTVLVSKDEEHPEADASVALIEQLRSRLPQLWTNATAMGKVAGQRPKDRAAYLHQQLQPLLIKGITAMCKEEPTWTDPVEYLANWLLANCPSRTGTFVPS